MEMFTNIVRLPKRKPRLTLLILAFILAGTAVAGALFWSQYHLHAAERALGQEALDEAQRHLDSCLLVRFRSASIHLMAARTARQREHYDLAEHHLAVCEQLDEQDSAVALERLLLIAQRGDLNGVEVLLKARAEDRSAESVLILEALAKGYENRFWHAEALACLNALLDRQPLHYRALILRARIEEHQAANGMPSLQDDALGDWETAVKLQATFEARLGLAGACYRAGRAWDACLEYERLRQEQSDHPRVLLGLARCRFNLHDLKASAELLDGLLAKQPENAVACAERGQLALHAGQLNEAERWLRQAATANPHDTDTLRLLQQCLTAEDKEEEAQNFLERLRETEMRRIQVNRLALQANRDPHDVALRYKIACELMQIGQEDEAVAALYLVLEQDPGHSEARADLADYLERKGQPDRAARYRQGQFTVRRTAS